MPLQTSTMTGTWTWQFRIRRLCRYSWAMAMEAFAWDLYLVRNCPRAVARAERAHLQQRTWTAMAMWTWLPPLAATLVLKFFMGAEMEHFRLLWQFSSRRAISRSLSQT